MLTETELKIKGLEILTDALGDVDAEKFISLLLREPFDYTQWQRHLFKDMPIERLSRKAMDRRKRQG